MKTSEFLEAARNVANTTVFSIAGTPVTISTIAVFVLLLLATWVASRLMQRALRRALGLRGIRDEGTVGVAQRLLHYSVMALGAGVSLQTLGINLSALFAAGAVFAIGLGFAMQNIAQNFVSGIILLLERSIKPGDVLRVEGQLVKVQKMGIRATLVRTLDEEEMIVPNSSMVQTTVTNYTLQDSIYRVRAPVGVIYGSDLRRVREVLEQVGRSMPWSFEGRDPVVLLTDFGASSVDFEVSVWMEEPWTVRRAKSQLNEAIWWALKDAGITIAFPQLDVHFDAPVTDSLRALGKSA
jgi:small-conductance mechanosensitive channel